MKRYAIHPGIVDSKTDRDSHYISSNALMRLYNLAPSQCIIWDEDRPDTIRGRRWEDYIHLFPRYHGDYMDYIKREEP